MRKFKKYLMLFFSAIMALSVVGINSAVYAQVEEVPFYTESKQGIYDNLLTHPELANMRVATIRKEGNNELGFCMAKKKWFPGSNGTLYSSNTDPNSWSWGRGDGTFVNKEIVQQVQNVMYAYHFDLANRLGDYGDPNDTMSLYAANQITLWLIIENSDPSKLSFKEGLTAEQKTIAERQLAMINDLFAARNTVGYETGGRLVNLGDSNKDAAESYDLTKLPIYTFNGKSTNYYRTPLLALVPNQSKGILYNGNEAFSYKVTLQNAPAGSFIADSKFNIVEDGTFGLSDVNGNMFYIYIPIDAESGSMTVNVESTMFKKMGLALWTPISENAYQDIMKDAKVDDKASDSLTLSWSKYVAPVEPDKVKTAKVCISKIGNQMSRIEKVQSEFGEISNIIWEEQPLKGAEFKLLANERFTDGLGKVHLKDSSLYPYNIATSDTGKVCWSNIPMSQTGNTSYKVVEAKSPEGFKIDNPETVITINSESNITEKSITNNPILFNFSVIKQSQDKDNNINPLPGAIFGVYNTKDINVKEATIPAGTLVATLTSEVNGEINGKNISLPAGQDYKLKELKAPEGYIINTEEFVIKASLATDKVVTVPVMNASNAEVNNIINQAKVEEVFRPDVLSFSGTKTLDGRALLDTDEFRLSVISNDTSAPLPDKPVVANKANEFKFNFDLTFNKEHIGKTYEYTIKEAKSNIQFVTNDTKEYKFTVKVEKNSIGNVDAYILDGTNRYEAFDSLNFVNTYKKEFNDVFTIKGIKTLVGREWLPEDEFIFSLKDLPDDDGQLLGQIIGTSVKGSDVSKEFNFGEITITQPGIYKFEVTEEVGNIPNVTYDQHKELVTVKAVETQEGSLLTTVIYENPNKQMVEFINTYDEKFVNVSIKGDKMIANRDWLDTDVFNFQLRDLPDDDGQIINEILTTEVNSKTPNKQFEFNNLVFTKVGTYKFEVTEVQGLIPGLQFDQTKELVIVNITEDANKDLVAEVVYEDKTSENPMVHFTNVYTPNGTSIVLKGSKTLTGRDWNKDDKFTFVLKDVANEGTDVDAGNVLDKPEEVILTSSDKDKVFEFNAVKFEKEGIYKFTIEEIAGKEQFMKYDSHIEDVTVTVTKNEKGELQAVAKYSTPDSNLAKFENILELPLEGSIKLTKLDKSNNKPIENVEFTLQSRTKGSSEWKTVKVAKTDKDGIILFDKLFADAEYRLKETIPDGYILESSIPTITLANNNKQDSITVYNTPIKEKGNIELSKVDKTTKKPLENVEFTLYFASDKNFENPLKTAKTDKNGVVKFDDLTLGRYVIVESKGLEQYIPLEKPVEVLLNKANQKVQVVVNNELYYGEVKLVKTDKDDSKVLVKGAVYGIYNENNKLIKEAITDENGSLSFGKLVYGRYYVKEITPAEGYLIDKTVYQVDVTDKDKAVYKLNVTDEKVKGEISIIKTDMNDKPLKGAKFTLYNKVDKDKKHPIVTVETNDKGMASIKDLPKGEYVLVETQAPNGYIKYEKDINVNLSKIKHGDVISVKIKNKPTPPTPPTTPPGKPQGGTSTPPKQPNKPVINTGEIGADLVKYVGIGLVAIAVFGGCIYLIVKSKKGKDE